MSAEPGGHAIFASRLNGQLRYATVAVVGPSSVSLSVPWSYQDRPTIIIRK